jgi:glycosyltransferase involved in cell wall biosynthesis
MPNTNEFPKVSVITPFYNRAGFLRPVLNTLAGQTLTEFELIAVDDGSNDDLAAAIERSTPAFPVRLVRLYPNAGAASARNAGLDHARGRYVAFLDSDDAWAPEKLLRQYEQLENAPDRQMLVSLTRQLVMEDRAYVAPGRLLTKREPVGSYLFQHYGVIQSSMMFMAADLAKSVRWVDGGRGHDDWSFALRLERAGAHFEMLPEALTIYNNRQGRLRRSPAYSEARFGWLEQWRHQLGEGPYHAACAAFASNMPGRRRVRHLRLVIGAFHRGAIPLRRAAYYLAAWAFPVLRSAGTRVKNMQARRGPARAWSALGRK